MNHSTASKTYKVHVHGASYKQKPTKAEGDNIFRQIMKNPPQSLTINELADCAVNGHTFTVALFEGERRTKQHWRSQQLLPYDIDDGTPFEELLQRIKDDGFDITFAYSTFSSTPEHPKFRMVTALDEEITDFAQMEELMTVLVPAYIPEIDRNAVKITQPFYGGKELIYWNPNYVLPLRDFIGACVACKAYQASKAHNAARTANKYKHLLLNPDSDEPFDKQLVKNYDFDLACTVLQVMRDLRDGNRLGHRALFGLATNLVWINGGEKWFKARLKGTINDRPGKLELTTIANKYQYRPTQMRNFSPYLSDHRYKNLLEVGKLPITPIRIEPRDEEGLMTLAEMETKFVDLLNKAVADRDHNHLFLVPTGAGKTEEIMKILGCTLAFPTHALKDEVSERMKAKQIDHFVTAEIPNDLPASVRNRINYLYTVGAYSNALGELQTYARQYPSIRAYLNNHRRMLDVDGTILTTHNRVFFNTSTRNALTIFDEDPLKNMFEIHSVKLSDIELLISEGGINQKDKQILKDYVSKMLYGEMSNSVVKLPYLAFNNYDKVHKAIINSNNKFSSNILDAFNAEWHLVLSHEKSDYLNHVSDDLNFYFMFDNSLFLGGNPNLGEYESFNAVEGDRTTKRHFIVTSATASPFIYKQLYGDKIKIHDLRNVKLRGLLRQNPEYSFSRQSLSQQLEKENPIIAEIRDSGRTVITFKDFKHYFDNAATDLHFGAVEGIDKYKGQDLIVLGTPHLNPAFLVMLCQPLGIETKPSDFDMQRQVVEYGSFRFTFNTYKREELRLIQFHLIEEQLIQAVGRARLLRTDATVDVYSNFPLEESLFPDEATDDDVPNI